jgi:hypothetical protein
LHNANHSKFAAWLVANFQVLARYCVNICLLSVQSTVSIIYSLFYCHYTVFVNVDISFFLATRIIPHHSTRRRTLARYQMSNCCFTRTKISWEQKIAKEEQLYTLLAWLAAEILCPFFLRMAQTRWWGWRVVWIVWRWLWWTNRMT